MWSRLAAPRAVPPPGRNLAAEGIDAPLPGGGFWLGAAGAARAGQWSSAISPPSGGCRRSRVAPGPDKAQRWTMGEAAISRSTRAFSANKLADWGLTADKKATQMLGAGHVRYWRRNRGCNIAADSEQHHVCLATTQFQALWPRGWLSGRPKKPSGARIRVFVQTSTRTIAQKARCFPVTCPRHRCTRRPRANTLPTGPLHFQA